MTARARALVARLATLAAFSTVAALAGCSKPADTPRAGAPASSVTTPGAATSTPPARSVVAPTPPARVGRLADLAGTVHRFGENGWEPALRNEPLSTGDRLATEPDAHAVVQVGSATLRLGPRSEIIVARLDDHSVRVRLDHGELTLHVRESALAHDFAIETADGFFVPQTATFAHVAIENGRSLGATFDGLLRFEARDTSQMDLLPGQRAEEWREGKSDTAHFRWLPGLPTSAFVQQARKDDAAEHRVLVAAGADGPSAPVAATPLPGSTSAPAGSTALSAASPSTGGSNPSPTASPAASDPRAVHARAGPVAPSASRATTSSPGPTPAAGPTAASRRLPPELTGATDLLAAGRWQRTDTGWAWFPPVSADWVPFRDGRWAWIAPWGWTWIDDARWGFAPFHYGRWAPVGGRWAWHPPAPSTRPVYAAATVVWLADPGSAEGGGAGGVPSGAPAGATSRGGASAAAGGPPDAAPLVAWRPAGPAEPIFPAHALTPAYWAALNPSSPYPKAAPGPAGERLRPVSAAAERRGDAGAAPAASDAGSATVRAGANTGAGAKASAGSDRGAGAGTGAGPRAGAGPAPGADAGSAPRTAPGAGPSAGTGASAAAGTTVVLRVGATHPRAVTAISADSLASWQPLVRLPPNTLAARLADIGSPASWTGPPGPPPGRTEIDRSLPQASIPVAPGR